MSLEGWRIGLQSLIVRPAVAHSQQHLLNLQNHDRISQIRVARGTSRDSRRCFTIYCSAVDDRSLTDFTTSQKEDTTQTLQATYDTSVSERLKYRIVPVGTAEEALAAATLRAQLFFRYAEAGCQTSRRLPYLNRSQDQLNAQIRSEYNRKAKMDFHGMKVTALLAVCDQSEQKRFDLHSQGSTHLYLTTPPEVPCRGFDIKREPVLAIGTLDLQVGATLPGESLEGRRPYDDASIQRGYIFNLCVHKAARRNGVASSLMKVSTAVAQLMGLKVLYIHVEEGNERAAALYRSLGYNLEQAESEEVALSLGRPRRFLLRLDVPSLPEIAL